MTATKRKTLKLHLLIFVFIVLASGWIGVILDSFLTDQPEGNSLGMDGTVVNITFPLMYFP